MQNSGPSRRLFLASLAAFVPAARPLRAQEWDATFSSDVRVVSVLATVRDKQGKFVSNLAKNDFLISEDGRPQTIKYFSQETDLPLTLGLLVDTSMSQRRVLGEEKTASYRFLDKVLRADKDQTFIIHFDHESELLQDLTSSHQQLQKALDELELPADQRSQSNRGGNPGGGGGGYPGSRGGITLPGGIGFPGGGMGGRRSGRGQGGGRQGGRRQGGAGTTLYDAILLASDEIMRKQKGRKALIVLTDGVDNGSKTSLSDAIEAAQRADTLVYSILFSDSQAYQQGVFGGGGGKTADGKKILQRISLETGGSFYEVSKKLSIEEIYDRLQEELRNQYSIGYSSDKVAADSGFRAIKVTTARSGLTVQTRQGYYAVSHP
ncbi:MAG: VWA domain-containing protein [Acidobacteriota bacterium]|nr:VWA domain-containing protein [Acidobacteriota bacterium]